MSSGRRARVRLEAPLRAGSHATVWRASRDGRPVAAKCVPAFAEGARARLEREAALLRRASGPGIVPLLDEVVVEDQAALLLPLAEHDLEEALDDGPLPAAAVRALGRDLLGALATLRRVGLVHGDVKPANVLRVGGRWLLGDLGVAIDLDAADRDGAAGDAGSAAYLDPSGRLGDRDLWALAVTLVEAATGRLPFAAPTGTDTIAAAGAGLTAPVHVPGDPDLGALLTEALCPDPSLRPSPGAWRERLAEDPPAAGPDVIASSAAARAPQRAEARDLRGTRDFARPAPADPPAPAPEPTPAATRPRPVALVAAGVVLATTLGAGGAVLRGAGPVGGSDPAGHHDPHGPQQDLQVEHR